MNNKIRPPTRTVRPVERHASNGIGKPYPMESREKVMWLLQHRPHILKSEEVREMQAAHVFPVYSTIDRWVERQNSLGHFRPYRRTGNRRASREIIGQSLIDLTIYRVIHCKARLYEIRAFLFMREPTVEPYSNSQVCRAEKKIELTRKRASTTAHQAYLPRNLMLRKMYFTTNYPTGIFYVNINDMIDINEMGLYLETTNRKLGKTVRGMRADDEGNYNRD